MATQTQPRVIQSQLHYEKAKSFIEQPEQSGGKKQQATQQIRRQVWPPSTYVIYTNGQLTLMTGPNKREPYNPSDSDLKATDWQVEELQNQQQGQHGQGQGQGQGQNE